MRHDADHGSMMIKRRLLNVLTILSLLLCAAVVALWVRSYWRSDYWSLRYHRTALRAQSIGGTLMLVWVNDRSDQGTKATWEVWPQSPLFSWRTLGEFYAETNVGSSDVSRVVSLPQWCVVGASLVLPLTVIVSRRRRRLAEGRLTYGLCMRCGYDLRGSPSRCPECGAVPAVPVAR
jgi:hypothetical protein